MSSKTMQDTPQRHRDLHVGSFFLAEKEGGPEFPSADEEVLMLFVSQAATEIANACTHRGAAGAGRHRGPGRDLTGGGGRRPRPHRSGGFGMR